MEETKRNSMKLDIEAVRVSDNDRDQPTESYKQISEFDNNDKSTAKTMVREKTEHAEDGADEKMLGTDEKDQLAKKDEVKFIAASDRSNGDAKIDIGHIDKSFTGMTKEELMKYANDPFWVRLRWIFFILFWLLWIAMLVGAILIILRAPKCSAPAPLSWFKEGPLVQLPPNKVDSQLLEKLKSIDAKGVIYKLPADKTYSIDEPKVESHIKELVESYKNTSIKVILDLTPNYVTTEDKLYKKALDDETYRSAFIWLDRARQPNNWLPKEGGEKSAWKEVLPLKYVLSQFGANFIDLQLNDTIAKEKFKDVLRQLVRLGVKGFRLANAKHYIIDKNAQDEGQSNVANTVHTDYAFWTHTGTTFQPGLGQLLHEFWQVVHNETNGEGFLTVSENIERPDVFSIADNTIGFDLPIVGVLPTILAQNSSGVAKRFINEVENTARLIGKSTWLQWPYDKKALEETKIGSSEYNKFLFLLPGVPVAELDVLLGTNNSNVAEIKNLEVIRKTQSFQHGSFEVYTDNTTIAYSRLKSGNPGYFVILNPSNVTVSANYAFVQTLPDQLTVEPLGKSSTDHPSKVPSDAIPLPAHSTVVLTFAPKASTA